MTKRFIPQDYEPDELYVDYEKLALEQAKLLGNIITQKKDYETFYRIQKEAYEQLEHYIKNEETINYMEGYFTPVKTEDSTELLSLESTLKLMKKEGISHFELNNILKDYCGNKEESDE